LRIVIVGTAYPMRGGIAHYVALLYKHLKQKGHDVFVLSFKRQYPSLLFPGKTQSDESKELIPIKSLPVLDSINPVTWIKAFFLIKKIRPELIVFKYWMPFFAPCYAAVAFLSSRLLNVKTAYICDNIIPHEKTIGDRFLSSVGLKFIDYFIVQSDSVQRDLLSLKPDAKYELVPHPVYEIFPPALPMAEARKKLGIKENRVILYFGLIRPYKGVKYLVRAMDEIAEQTGARLLLCGEFYEGRDEIMDLIDKSQAKNKITLCDWFIPNEEVPLYFCAADLVVLPYVSATQSGIVQIAYNYNKPVVVTRVGGLPEIVPHGQTGYVVEPENPSAIAEAVKRFFNNKEKHDFESSVREVKKKYSWDRMVEAVERVVKGIANSE